MDGIDRNFGGAGCGPDSRNFHQDRGTESDTETSGNGDVRKQLAVLCDKGSIWLHSGGNKWDEGPPVPGTARDENVERPFETDGA